MNEITEKMQQVLGNLREYAEVKVDEVKLTVAEKSSLVISTIIMGATLVLLGAIVGLFVSVGIALLIADMLGHLYAGFLIVAGLYILLGSIIFIGREKWIRVPVLNAIIRQLFSKPTISDETK